MPELIIDELVEESFKSRGGGVFELTGARPYRFAFSSAQRLDGLPPQANDIFPCTFVSEPNLIIACVAVYTPGAPALLTIDTGYIFKTSAIGGGVPDFGTKTGVVKLTVNARVIQMKTLAGDVFDAASFRKTLLPQTLRALTLSGALTGDDAVIGQSATPGALTFTEDFLGGVFAPVTGEADAPDDEDILATATGGRKLIRRSQKVWLTRREKAVAAGATLSVLTANKPNATYGVVVQDRTDKANYAALEVRGGAATAVPVKSWEKAMLEFDVVGPDVLVRNRKGVSVSIDITRGRIA